MLSQVNRRNFVKLSAAAAGAAGAMALVGAGTNRPTRPAKPLATEPVDSPTTSDMPCGQIGNLKLSRVILGSNLMGGHSHSRDLRYVGPLMRAYNTEEKILETLALAEAQGINTLSQGDWTLVRKYNEKHGGHMQQLRPLNIKETDTDLQVRDSIRGLVDEGAAAIYIFGHDGDKLVRAGRTDRIAAAMQWVRDEGLPAGVGGHSLHVVVECEKDRVAPDFYFKTFHSDRYWSRTLEENRDEYCWYNGVGTNPGEYHDNMWCMNSEQTAEIMKNVDAAWVAFKVLAAGAILPSFGFPYAFRNGADFIVVGMFDFQVEQNAKLAKDLLAKMRGRDRPWRA